MSEFAVRRNKKQEAGIKSFSRLVSWRRGHELVLAIYRQTKQFPGEEKFGLSTQMRRAAVSITSNITKGFSRPSYADKKHFYSIARGSLTELQNQLLIAGDVHYVEAMTFDKPARQAVTVHKLLTGLIKATQARVKS